MTTERLYYNDCYLREFTASVVEVGEDGLVAVLLFLLLDRLRRN